MNNLSQKSCEMSSRTGPASCRHFCRVDFGRPAHCEPGAASQGWLLKARLLLEVEVIHTSFLDGCLPIILIYKQC